MWRMRPVGWGGGWGLWICLLVLCICQALAIPLRQKESEDTEDTEGGRVYLNAVLGVAVLLSTVTTLLACVCCKGSRGFKELGSVSSRVEGSTNTLSNLPQQEITLFPPPGANLSLSSTQINFEPLPDIRPRAGTHPGPGALPASFPSSPLTTLPTDQWFAEPHQNFPRGQLQYVKELGNGWFGKVLEGRASGVFSDHTKGESPPVSSTSPSPRPLSTRVAVKVLKEDASQAEQTYFLHELRPYRDITHPNVLKVLAYCLETEPFLILLQLCPKGDLKSVVQNDKSLSEAALLRMVLDAASGLQHMHTQNFIHTDLASRNCLVDEDNTVKIGDYGYNIDTYKEEYYCAGDVALPLRWCAPETLRCTDTTIETKEVTKPANVWSFGIVMWEVLSRGELPYPSMDDDQVIQRVVVEKTCVPDKPHHVQLHSDKMYNIMRQCWAGEDTRPPMAHILSLITHLWQHSPHHTATTGHNSAPQSTVVDMDDFEIRWTQLQQQQNCRDHSIIHLGAPAEMRFESDFSLSRPGQLGAVASPSLQNLHGSAEDLDAKMAAKFGSALPSWLGVEPGQPIDSLTQEITDAILKLDDYLAGEKSEPSTAQTSPEKSGITFKVGKDSFVSNPPDAKLARMGGLSVEDGSGHPSLGRSLSEGEDEGFTMRLEQGEFTEMVRLKSQSVQDFMKLTVVDDGSDSDNASQRNSLAFEPLHQEKTYASEGNIKEALRDVKFMGELERLQAEHRYSIITEASKEYTSSIEYRVQEVSDLDMPEVGSTNKLATSTESVDSMRGHSEQDPFLDKMLSSEGIEEMKANDSKFRSSNESKEKDSSQKKPVPASPDCVVSSREPKPISLPDIVVHNNSVKLSRPSPSPEDSPAKILNKNQPKEFRFVFENDNDSDRITKSKELETSPQCDSVIFSENIKNIEANHIKENENSEPRDIVDKSGFHGGESANGDVRKFQSLIQESGNILTSTPLKNDRQDIYKVNENNINTALIDTNDGIDLHRENKKKLIYSENCEEKVCNKEEDEVGILERKEIKDVPSYKPEKVVKGEDIVIGALEDYSLDLFSVVKSTDTPLNNSEEKPSLQGLSREHLEKEISRTESKVSGIEYDLDQWDTFLDNTLSMDKSDTDFRDNLKAQGELGGDILTSTIKSPECFAENKEVKADNLDLSNTFEHSSSDEILEIMSSESMVECDDETEERPEIDATLFFSSESAVSQVPTDKNNSEAVQSDASVFFSAEEKTPTDKNKSDANIFSSESPLSKEKLAVDKNNIEAVQSHKKKDSNLSERLKTPTNTTSDLLQDTIDSEKSDLNIGKEITEKSDIILGMDDTEKSDINLGKQTPEKGDLNLSIETPEKSDVNLGRETPGSLSSSSVGLDTPSNSFSYKKEAPVDTTLDSLEDFDYTTVETIGATEIRNKSTMEKYTESPITSVSEMLINTPDNWLENNDRNKDNGVDLAEDNVLLNLSPVCISPSPVISTKESTEFEEVVNEVENGEFWQQQMMAWQEAAFETRQLLQEAAVRGVDSPEGPRIREDISEASPISEGSSRSHYSSTDILNLDDEGSYVSYNTTDDEEVLGYKPEDISALRAELSLKLGGVAEDQNQQNLIEPEEPEEQGSGERETVVINYRSIMASTLSPIKEESFQEDEDSPIRKLSLKSCSDVDSVYDPSIEFEEPDDLVDGTNITFSVSDAIGKQIINIDTGLPVGVSESAELDEQKLNTVEEQQNDEQKHDINEQSQNVSEQNRDNKQKPEDEQKHIATENMIEKMEAPHDSLILEDLDEDDGPPSIQIVNSCADLEAEDILLVDTETNQATIVDQGKPRSHLAFITDEEETHTEVEPFAFDESDDVAPESIPSVGGSRFDEMRYREQFLTNNPSWEKPHDTQEQEFEGDEESNPVGDFIISDLLPEDQPDTPQVPHYHSYFTSALSSITHPKVSSLGSLNHPTSLEQPEEPQHISLPYDVNYPAAGEQIDVQDLEGEHTSLPYTVNYPPSEQLNSLEDINGETLANQNGEETKISEIEDDEDVPIKLSFLGRFYSDDSEEKDEKEDELKKKNTPKDDKRVDKKSKSKMKDKKSADSHEASLLSDSDEDAKATELDDPSQMTSAEFLASGKYQTNDAEEVDEEIEIEAGYQEDSEDDDDEEKSGQRQSENVSQEPRYTPDWESDSDSDGDSSSTSGEFMWREEDDIDKKNEKQTPETEKPGEPCQPAQPASYILDVIEEVPERERREEEEDEEEDAGSGEESESGEEEFTPSQWNSDLTPSHSLLKSPLNKSNLKKRVRWKRQRHHRVYEYPPEPRSWDPPSTLPQTDHHRRGWQRSSLDYLTLADWELGSDEFIADDGGDMDDYVYHKPTRPAPPPPIYSLGSVAYDEGSDGFLVDNGEFFIRSSGSPFNFTRSTFSASDFFPAGRQTDYDVLFGAQNSGTRELDKLDGKRLYSGSEQTENNRHSDQSAHEFNDYRHEEYEKQTRHESKDDSVPGVSESDSGFAGQEDLEVSLGNASLGQLRHTRDRLRLEIPSISVGGKEADGLENGQSFPGVNLKRHEPEVSEV